MRANTTSKYIPSFENQRKNISDFVLKLMIYIVKIINEG
jgi:hypothetical protein